MRGLCACALLFACEDPGEAQRCPPPPDAGVPPDVAPPPDAPPAWSYTPCDPPEGAAAMRLPDAVQEILSAGCTYSGCHGEEPIGPDLRPEAAYAALVCARGVGVAPPRNLVEPGHPTRSYLLNKLDGTPRDVGGSGYPMPYGYAPLTPEQLGLLVAWIEADAPPQ